MGQWLSYRVDSESWKIEVDHERRVATMVSAQACVELYFKLITHLNEIEQSHKKISRLDQQLLREWGVDTLSIPRKIAERKIKLKHCIESLANIMSRSKAFTISFRGIQATPAQFLAYSKMSDRFTKSSFIACLAR